jgi:GT2 family glycosyltransferase
MPKKIAVAVLNWNGLSLLQRFLKKVLLDSSDLATVYLVDNGSSDESLNWTKEHLPAIKIISLNDNSGYAGGYNLAITQLDEDLIVLLNSDIETTSKWLEPIAKAFDENPRLGALQPKILDLKERHKFEYAGAAGGYMDQLGYPFCRGRLFDHLEADEGQYQSFEECFWATGASLVVRRAAFNEVRGLYSTLFAHMEEIDLCWKMQVADWKVAVEPASLVYHLGGATLDSASPQKTFLNFRNNLIILFLNLPSLASIRVILSRLILDGVAGLRFLSQGKPLFLFAILRAHFAFYAMFHTLYRERLKRKQKPLKELTGVYHGNLIFDFFARGMKTFKDLKF